MYINVAQLLKEPVGSTRDFELDETIGINGIHHVRGRIKLIRADFCVLVQGILYVDIMDTCSRCLCSFNHGFHIKLEDEFYPVVDIISGLRVSRNSDSLRIDQNHIIDLNDAIVQQAQISRPLKPLCNHDCAGICHVCGYNLNQGPCPCSHTIHANC